MRRYDRIAAGLVPAAPWKRIDYKMKGNHEQLMTDAS
jgi:hypothetical protein